MVYFYLMNPSVANFVHFKFAVIDLLTGWCSVYIRKAQISPDSHARAHMHAHTHSLSSEVANLPNRRDILCFEDDPLQKTDRGTTS